MCAKEISKSPLTHKQKNLTYDELVSAENEENKQTASALAA